MSVLNVLCGARHLLVAGLAPQHPLMKCCDRLARPVEWNAEEVVLFSVDGALKAASFATPDLVLEAWSVLEQVHAPVTFAADELLSQLPRAEDGKGVDIAKLTDDQVHTYVQLVRAAAAAKETNLDFWLQRPNRRLPEVIKLFDLAISRASAREAA
jgi:hypothetical protein